LIIEICFREKEIIMAEKRMTVVLVHGGFVDGSG
jgi:hypothetical protein